MYFVYSVHWYLRIKLLVPQYQKNCSMQKNKCKYKIILYLCYIYFFASWDMRVLKSSTILNFINSYLIDSPQPSNLSYLWNFGSLLGFSLLIQIITGVVLAMHYNPSIIEAFNSVEFIMRDVNNGWLIRYFHSNTASAFFFWVYLHIGRGLYYGSYRAPRTLVWTIGTFIFILMMAIAFLGYVLPYGQMSLWGNVLPQMYNTKLNIY